MWHNEAHKEDATVNLKIFEGHGIRTYGRNISANRMALAIVGAVKALEREGWTEEGGCLFADVVKHLIKIKAEGVAGLKYPAAYAAVARALPFEHADAGLIYQLKAGEAQTKIYEKTKRIIRTPGKLESAALTRVPRRSIADQVAAAVASAVKKDDSPDIIRIRDSLETQIADLWREMQARGLSPEAADEMRAYASIKSALTELYARTKALEEKFALL
jgi:hypothetical protein